MTKIYENLLEGVTRWYSMENIKAWAKALENVGLGKCVLIVKDIGEGKTSVQQYYDYDEGEKFYNLLKLKLDQEMYFEDVCEEFFKAIERKDRVKMFEALEIFGEIEEYPEITDFATTKKLLRIREQTQGEIYKLK